MAEREVLGGARFHMDNIRTLTAYLQRKFMIISLISKLGPFMKDSKDSDGPLLSRTT